MKFVTSVWTFVVNSVSSATGSGKPICAVRSLLEVYPVLPWKHVSLTLSCSSKEDCHTLLSTPLSTWRLMV